MSLVAVHLSLRRALRLQSLLSEPAESAESSFAPLSAATGLSSWQETKLATATKVMRQKKNFILEIVF
jgi:hypothetical protein